MFEVTAGMVFKIVGIIFLILLVFNWLAYFSDIKVKGFRAGDFLIIFIFAVVIIANSRRLKEVADLLPDGPEIVQQTKDQVSGSAAFLGKFSEYVRWRTQAAVVNEVGRNVPGLDVGRVQDVLKNPAPETLGNMISFPSLESLGRNPR
jgi:hypothetical protein